MMTLSLQTLPLDIIHLIVRNLILVEGGDTEPAYYRQDTLYTSYSDWNLVVCDDLLQLAMASKKLKAIIDPLIYKNLGMFVDKDDVYHYSEVINQYAFHYNSAFNYRFQPQLYFGAMGKNAPISVMQHVQHLIISLNFDEYRGNSNNVPVPNMIGPKYMPLLKEITLLFNHSCNFQDDDLESVGLKLKEYTSPIRIHMFVTRKKRIPIETDLKFLKLLDAYTTVETFELSSIGAFQKFTVNQVTMMKNLKSLILFKNRPGFLTNDMTKSEIYRHLSCLPKLENLEVKLIGNNANDEGFEWKLPENLERLATDMKVFNAEYLPKDLTMFDSVTCLEIRMGDDYISETAKLPFCNLNRLAIDNLTPPDIPVIEQFIDSNPRLVNLCLRWLTPKLYYLISPLLSQIQNLECPYHVNRAHRDFNRNPPINYLPTQCPNIRSMYLPFGNYGSLHFEDIIDMALSEDICPNLSTIQVYFGDFDQDWNYIPKDLFVENPEEISEILPKGVTLDSFLFPVETNDILLDNGSATVQSFLFDFDRFRKLVEGIGAN